ncbi:MAG TPA: heparan-alpha-glucosaminide N-acetyltransferase domain-containing protein [Vicinamibacterales bacterium]|nr:heparan-alpha-glucosaminide N-acetyltransferase domain-containing protein [Vicinamibacterales bacterium]
MTPPRLVSLDVFRGLTMASMVIVNNPGDWGNVYAPLLHAPWHGLTPTDLIFPFFLFIVGVSITLAKRSSASAATIFRRALLIFALGMLLALYPRFDFSTVRIPGVLQRIAVCYLAVALIHRTAGRSFSSGEARRAILITLTGAMSLLLIYWALIFRDLTPDGNLGAVIDRAIFGPHLWRQSRTWDPEGLLSTLPAIATTLTGLAAGYVIASEWTMREKLRALAIGSLAAMALGFAWSFAFPLNKSLWTSSYVLVTSGLAGLLLARLHGGLDNGRFGGSAVRGFGGFVILGRNALLLFVVSGCLAKTLSLIRVDNGQGSTLALGRWIYLSWFAPLADPKNASLLYAFANLAVLFLLLWWLHRRRWYVRV